ncbi:MAG: RluA family pseudouridine synthase [Eubacteriales bacterium]|nr:RluA family pseudouridine synthase [Eubacteriales bacterium]
MRNFRAEDTIIYEDGQILVCHKPSGIAVQNAGFGVMDMECGLKNYLAKKKPGGEIYLGIVHRLDQPVEGVLVFAKTPLAARELSRQMSKGEMCKKYLAVTEGKPEKEEGVLEDYLKKNGKTNTSFVVQPGTPGGKKARLFYRVLQKTDISADGAGAGAENRYLVEIILETGRHHQIRVQMAHAGMPLLGDRKYNAQEQKRMALGLCSCELSFVHPKTKKKMEFHVNPSGEAFEGFRIKEENE